MLDDIPKSYKEENMWFKLLSGDMIELATDKDETYEVQLGRILNVSTLSVGLEKEEKEDMYYVIVKDHPHKHREWSGGFYTLIVNDEKDDYEYKSLKVFRHKNTDTFTNEWDYYYIDYFTNGKYFVLKKDAVSKKYLLIEEDYYLVDRYYTSLYDLLFDLSNDRFGEDLGVYCQLSSEVKTHKVDDIVKKDMLSYLFRCLVNA